MFVPEGDGLIGQSLIQTEKKNNTKTTLNIFFIIIAIYLILICVINYLQKYIIFNTRRQMTFPHSDITCNVSALQLRMKNEKKWHFYNILQLWLYLHSLDAGTTANPREEVYALGIAVREKNRTRG